MRYLVCYNCGGYYELKNDESPDDFDSCSCGGELLYTDYLEGFLTEQRKINAEKKFKQRIEDEKLLKSSNNKSNQYYSNKEFIILLIGGVFLIIIFGWRFLLRIFTRIDFPISMSIFAVVVVLGLFVFLLSVGTGKN